MRRSSFSFRVLDSGFNCTNIGEPWLSLVKELWGPFEAVEDVHQRREISIGEANGGRIRASISGHEDFASQDPWWVLVWLRAAILRISVGESSSIGLGLHACCVVRDNRSVLLIGPNGSGKTTLTMELLLRGWSLVAEDLAIVEKGHIHPFPQPLSVKDLSWWGRTEGLWEAPDWLPSPERVFLLPSSIFPLVSSPVAAERAYFPIFREGSDSGVLELSRARSAALAGQQVTVGILSPTNIGQIGWAGAQICFQDSGEAANLIEEGSH